MQSVAIPKYRILKHANKTKNMHLFFNSDCQLFWAQLYYISKVMTTFLLIQILEFYSEYQSFYDGALHGSNFIYTEITMPFNIKHIQQSV